MFNINVYRNLFIVRDQRSEHNYHMPFMSVQ